MERDGSPAARQLQKIPFVQITSLSFTSTLQHFNIWTGMKSYRYSDNGAFFWPIWSNLPWPSPARHEWYRLQARGPGLNRPRTNGVPPILHHGSCSVGLRIWTPPSWGFLYIFPKIILYPSFTLRFVSQDAIAYSLRPKINAILRLNT